MVPTGSGGRNALMTEVVETCAPNPLSFLVSSDSHSPNLRRLAALLHHVSNERFTMFHVITLFTVPNGEEAFVRSMAMDGLWHSLAQQFAPDLIATDLLRHQFSPLYLCHDLWATPEAYFRGLHSTTVQSLFLIRRHMASSCFELGAFRSPVCDRV